MKKALALILSLAAASSLAANIGVMVDTNFVFRLPGLLASNAPGIASASGVGIASNALQAQIVTGSNYAAGLVHRSGDTIWGLTGSAQATNLAPAATFFIGPLNTGVAFTAAGGTTNLHVFAAAHQYEFMPSAPQTTVAAQFYLVSTNGISDLELWHWKFNGDTNHWDMVGSSGNLQTGGLLAGQTNTITLPNALSNCVEGDRWSLQVGYSGGSITGNFVGDTNNWSYVETNGMPGTSYYVWSTNGLQSAAIPVVLYSTSPYFVIVGPSIFSGAGEHTSPDDTNNPSWFDLTAAPAWNLSRMWSNAPGRDLAIGGLTLEQINTAEIAYALAMHPSIAVTAGGENNLLFTGETVAQITAAATNNANAFLTNGIKTIVVGITPFSRYNASALAYMTNAAVINSNLAYLAPIYGYTYADPFPTLGEFDSRGPAGNLWALKTEYAWDAGLHPNNQGQVRLAETIAGAATKLSILGDLKVGHIAVDGIIEHNGGVPSYDIQGRSPYYMGVGQSRTNQAGGAFAGSTNKPGGVNVISGGIPTGSGTNAVALATSQPGASGTNDALPRQQIVATQDPLRSILNNIAGSGQIPVWWLTGADGRVSSVIYTNGMLGFSEPGYPDIPVFWIALDGNAYVGAQGASTGNATFNILRGSNSYDQNHSLARLDAIVGAGLRFGYMTDSHRGWMAAARDGVAWDDLAINPFGGNVLIGTTNDAGNYVLQINGNILGLNALTLNNTLNVTSGGANFSGVMTIPTGPLLVGTNISFGGNVMVDIEANHASTAYTSNPILILGQDGLHKIWCLIDASIGTWGVAEFGAINNGNAHIPISWDRYGGHFLVGTTTDNGNGGELQVNGFGDFNNGLISHNGADFGGSAVISTNGFATGPGFTLTLSQSANSTRGSATLSSGTVTVSTTAAHIGDLIVLGVTTSTSPGFLSYSIANNTGFTITSTSGTDASVVQWAILR